MCAHLLSRRVAALRRSCSVTSRFSRREGGEGAQTQTSSRASARLPLLLVIGVFFLFVFDLAIAGVLMERASVRASHCVDRKALFFLYWSRLGWGRMGWVEAMQRLAFALVLRMSGSGSSASWRGLVGRKGEGVRDGGWVRGWGRRPRRGDGHGEGIRASCKVPPPPAVDSRVSAAAPAPPCGRFLRRRCCVGGPPLPASSDPAVPQNGCAPPGSASLARLSALHPPPPALCFSSSPLSASIGCFRFF